MRCQTRESNQIHKRAFDAGRKQPKSGARQLRQRPSSAVNDYGVVARHANRIGGLISVVPLTVISSDNSLPGRIVAVAVPLSQVCTTLLEGELTVIVHERGVSTPSSRSVKVAVSPLPLMSAFTARSRPTIVALGERWVRMLSLVTCTCSELPLGSAYRVISGGGPNGSASKISAPSTRPVRMLAASEPSGPGVPLQT